MAEGTVGYCLFSGASLVSSNIYFFVHSASVIAITVYFLFSLLLLINCSYLN